MKVKTFFGFWCNLTVFLISFHQICGYRILGIFPHVGRSHSSVFEPLMIALANRGNNVTVISHFPLENPPENYRDISLKGSLSIWSSAFEMELFNYGYVTEWVMRHVGIANTIFNSGSESCKAMLENTEVKNLKKGDFDVVIIEQFNSDCGLGVAYKVKAPFIGITSHVMMAWTPGRLGLITNPSYIGSHYLDTGLKPNVFQVTEALLIAYLYKTMYYLFSQKRDHRVMQEYLGKDLPELETIAKNMSLILLNTYYPLSGVIPYSPNAVEIGGIHLKDPKPLSEELQSYLDGASDGVIVFSMGSRLRALSWPKDKLRAFQSALGKLPQKVLWKWEDKIMDGKPDNVKILSWIPQYDVLRHKNVKAFITHGGMLGMSEAAHCGVPTIAIPIYGDQFGNAAAARDQGVGVYLYYKRITEEIVLAALQEALSPRMQANAKRLSVIWRDRPMSAVDTGVYWVEHVARHGGSHLRPGSADLPLYRYLLLDVFALLLILAAIFTFVSFKLFMWFLSFFRLKKKIE